MAVTLFSSGLYLLNPAFMLIFVGLAVAALLYEEPAKQLDLDLELIEDIIDIRVGEFFQRLQQNLVEDAQSGSDNPFFGENFPPFTDNPFSDN